MKVQILLGNVNVRWHYGGTRKITPVGRKYEGVLIDQETTSCILTNDKKEEVAKGIVGRFNLDEPNKFAARKAAFGAAIKNFPKADKKVLWNSYMKAVKHIN